MCLCDRLLSVCLRVPIPSVHSFVESLFLESATACVLGSDFVNPDATSLPRYVLDALTSRRAIVFHPIPNPPPGGVACVRNKREVTEHDPPHHPGVLPQQRRGLRGHRTDVSKFLWVFAFWCLAANRLRRRAEAPSNKIGFTRGGGVW